MIKKSIFLVLLAFSLGLTAQTPVADTVRVVYNGSTATVSVADNVAQYLTVNQDGAHVSIAQSSDLATEITYTLSGSTSDGEFYMSGSYKATIELGGLTLTNTTPVYSGAAVHIQNGKRIKVKVVTGTTNTLTDAVGGSQKGCLYIKGHAEFAQKGTLNVVGNVKHGIKAGEYITLKNATINVTSAVGDGISCNQFFLMESGTVSISGTSDDGIQCDLDGDTSTGETADHEDEDSGNIYILGGTINISCTAAAAKGIKCEGDMNISGGEITITTSGKGTWDEDDQETKASCGLSADGNMNISGGTIKLTSTGSGGKGMKCDGVLTVSDGSITISTSGGLYYNNGTTENTNYTGNTDNVSSDYYSSPKGIKAGLKTQNGSSYTYSGGIVVSGGYIKVTTTGTNGEGIESKNTLEISGGELFVNAYDDAINAAQDITIDGGYVYARSTNNDGMDANGNFYINGGLVYAIGTGSPEVALDANSEERKKLYINGGVVIAIGGIESGSSVNQPYTQFSSVSSNTWYSLTYGDNVVAFLTPTISGNGSFGGGPNGGGNPGGGPGGNPGGGPGGNPGGGNSTTMFVSAPSTPSLTSGVTISDGTSIFEENCFIDAAIGGTNAISEAVTDNVATVRSMRGRIIVEGGEGNEVRVLDVCGRQLVKGTMSNAQYEIATSSLPAGIYFVKIGNHPAQKVVVMK
ncbi:MAG: carbohydrate-binding domain-containing protein [Bacteroidales bacterium]|nr:carbohydrate-binding domain-containing protein [Bacteroidales bacterium]